jgi:hypothetical protein
MSHLIFGNVNPYIGCNGLAKNKLIMTIKGQKLPTGIV